MVCSSQPALTKCVRRLEASLGAELFVRKGRGIALTPVGEMLLQQSRREGWYAELEQVMQRTEQSGGKVMLISAAHEGGKRLEGLGGIAALLRYRYTFARS
jgi:DNA-binding transcriptional LysR family regulator